MKLGKSQQVVIDWLKRNPNRSVQQIGDACYHVSYYGSQRAPIYQQTKNRWASKILQTLKKKGLVGYDDINTPLWYVKEELE